MCESKLVPDGAQQYMETTFLAKNATSTSNKKFQSDLLHVCVKFI